VLLALAAGVALADGSIVTLGLPQILDDLDTTVEGVAAVIGVYTVVLAVALLPLERAASAFSVRALGAGGLGLMALASVACALASGLTVLLVARGAQALGGAAGLVAVFPILGGGEGPGRRLWRGRRCSARRSARRSAARSRSSSPGRRSSSSRRPSLRPPRSRRWSARRPRGCASRVASSRCGGGRCSRSASSRRR